MSVAIKKNNTVIQILLLDLQKPEDTILGLNSFISSNTLSFNYIQNLMIQERNKKLKQIPKNMYIQNTNTCSD